MTLNMQDPELEFAVAAVRAAGDVARKIQNDLAVTGITKNDLSPVTVADFAAQAIVSKALYDRFPDAVLVGEESAADLRTDEGKPLLALVTDYVGTVVDGAAPDAVCDWIDRGQGEPGERFWTLDPVDGTKGYLRGEQYAVALALIENGAVKLGVLGCPNLGPHCELEDRGAGALALAVRGRGAWAAPFDDGETYSPLHVSERADVGNARMLRSVESGHTNVDKMGDLVSALSMSAEPVKMDSQAKYAVLASGGGEVMCRLLSEKRPDYRECIWDQAAGMIVVEEAGGRVTDLSGKPLDFSAGRRLENNRGVLATNGRVHEAVLEGLRAIGA